MDKMKKLKLREIIRPIAFILFLVLLWSWFGPGDSPPPTPLFPPSGDEPEPADPGPKPLIFTGEAIPPKEKAPVTKTPTKPKFNPGEEQKVRPQPPRVFVEGSKRDSCYPHPPPKGAAPRNFTARPIIILGGQSNEENTYENCDVGCYFSPETDTLKFNADGYLDFHILGGGRHHQPALCPYGHNILATMESRANYGGIYASGDQDIKDISPQQTLYSNVELTSITASYLYWTPEFNEMPDMSKKIVDVTAVISNCDDKTGRITVSKFLRADTRIKMKFYGSCGPDGRSTLSKKELVLQSKFALVFENSDNPDYATEKYMDALRSQAIPIIIGDKGYRFWLPAEKSGFLVSEFKELKDLADMIVKLSSNDVEYLEYHAWRSHWGSDDFKAKFGISAVHTKCRQCLYLADLWQIQNNEVPQDPNSLFIRQRNTFYFDKIPFKSGQFTTLQELYDAVDKVFEKVFPVDTESPDYAPPYSGGKRIFRIYRSYITQHQVFRENSGNIIDSDEKASQLKGNDKLDVIYVY